jgi:hypothetical protein
MGKITITEICMILIVIILAVALFADPGRWSL